ncbi:MAG: glycosyltransferase, partial [Solirubrobacterales bacterium]
CERWVLVGDEATAQRLRAYEPLRAYAKVVATVPPGGDDSQSAARVAALEVVDRYSADRVVIASQQADDEGLLELVRAFKSIGVPVSLLPRPLDLLEAPVATPSQVGGVPLIDVEALATRRAVPYSGPDRRHTRRTKVSVVVPAMNEEGNIGHVLKRLPENLHEVILVDGNSKDKTIMAAEEAHPGIRVLSQTGRGKGDAFRTGFAAVTGNLVVMLDADGSADPAEIPRFVEALEAGADFAKGSRFLDGGGSADITRLRSLGNSVLSGTANLLHGTHFTDLCYGYNAFWARCLPFIALDVPGFEVETLINLRIAGAGMKITEVPSYEADRISGQSNLNTFRDGFRVLGTILSETRRRRTIRRGRHQPVASVQLREAETASAETASAT